MKPLQLTVLHLNTALTPVTLIARAHRSSGSLAGQDIRLLAAERGG
jgi:hypothetical protein